MASSPQSDLDRDDDFPASGSLLIILDLLEQNLNQFKKTTPSITTTFRDWRDTTWRYLASFVSLLPLFLLLGSTGSLLLDLLCQLAFAFNILSEHFDTRVRVCTSEAQTFNDLWDVLQINSCRNCRLAPVGRSYLAPSNPRIADGSLRWYISKMIHFQSQP